MTRQVCVAIDATPLGDRVTGAGRALKNLAAQLPAVDPATQYVAFATARGAERLGFSGRIITVDSTAGTRWELIQAGRAAKLAGADLLFTVRELTPLVAPPTVVHIYEPPAYRLRHPTIHSFADVKRLAKDVALNALLATSLRRANAVTAGSETTAAWLKARLGIKTDVIYPGIDPVFLTPAASTSAQNPPYFLHLATADPRDNTELVLRAFALARIDGVRLRLVGSPSDHRAALLKQVADLDIGASVDVLGWVSDGDLSCLYREAIALLHPTRYESYAGFPALEAMACGTPVIALEADGSTEALRGSAVLIEREDPHLLAAELRRLAFNPLMRTALGSEGRNRSRELTWERSARAVAAVFHRVLAERPR